MVDEVERSVLNVESTAVECVWLFIPWFVLYHNHLPCIGKEKIERFPV